MPFLLPNQQRQSIEGTLLSIHITLLVADLVKSHLNRTEQGLPFRSAKISNITCLLTAAQVDHPCNP